MLVSELPFPFFLHLAAVGKKSLSCKDITHTMVLFCEDEDSWLYGDDHKLLPFAKTNCKQKADIEAHYKSECPLRFSVQKHSFKRKQLVMAGLDGEIIYGQWGMNAWWLNRVFYTYYVTMDISVVFLNSW